MLIDNCDVIWLSAVGLLPCGTVNSSINNWWGLEEGFCIVYIEVLRSFHQESLLQHIIWGLVHWSLSLSIAAMSECLAISGPILQARASTPAITRYLIWISLKWYPSSSCYQEKPMGILSSYSRFSLIFEQSDKWKSLTQRYFLIDSETAYFTCWFATELLKFLFHVCSCNRYKRYMLKQGV